MLLNPLMYTLIMIAPVLGTLVAGTVVVVSTAMSGRKSG